MSEFDRMRRLVEEVEKKDIIWNFKNPDYENMDKRDEAWMEVCCQLIDNFMTYESARRDRISKAIIFKWNEILDVYYLTRFCGKVNPNKKEDNLSAMQKYLSFLDPTYRTNEDQNKKINNLVPKTKELVKSLAPVYDLYDHLTVKKETSDKKFSDTCLPAPNEQILSVQSFVRFLTEKRNPDNLDDDLAFFQSVLPAIINLTKESILPFRLEVMNTVEEIEGKIIRRRRIVNSE